MKIEALRKEVTLGVGLPCAGFPPLMRSLSEEYTVFVWSISALVSARLLIEKGLVKIM